ncbi:ATP-binding cassette sub-family G member 1 [Toxorhynchites rutilus septentrionalis]|uniref:ATP-binding cassette sub-family G member 1 n=1 Tax=Toxorhynchites rutilus septentrionalis TaxID=329112 RepID=UPI0024784229|nr:ATP-binding cassette sub-family G member 1 [Toxorhynchites rutilus septentrionalis]XP_055637745.1 ATP-binding cassette sub-family G member 1 [Toxorhynchites rutilus septentrionalis]XP_055637746.1 ATP-binding cassette sub-family G member 1 [Toxorhynchites rutilus septentrionalis]XP_055637747.1 ATP-binding cassette sub-family G member 1 [Toxorhynchites rutilus septentrionalis]XP_055637748.1 ATP-binding cassette sub-family G member 1 [Toxorhynchites rutilus septentrionalis]
MDITFNNIYYTVSVGKKDKKTILNGVSGRFNSGELTAIMGPSGAGKSSLLNILTGYTKAGVKGSLNIGGSVDGSKLCSYILQEDNLHPFFTVQEIMMMACDLKISSRFLKHIDKERLVDSILDTLHLKFTKMTRCGNLSGGQKKRLSIALELIDNPPVLFLDEPTTGLDSSSSLYTIKLLQGLAREGRTIVCTIHQPSATVFEMFDHVYGLAEGHCVYQGSSLNIVPYLRSVGLQCPQYHNAADYLLEVANKEYGNFINALSKAAIDCHWRKPQSCIAATTLPHYLAFDSNHNGGTVYHSTVFGADSDCSKQQKHSRMRRPSEFTKLLILMKRCNVQLYRDWTVTHLKLFVHVVCAIVVGLLFGDSGVNGTKGVSNIASFLVHVLYLWYTTLMPGVLKFPSEMKILRKESFNNWYKIRTYFIASMLTTLPVQIFFSVVYSTIVFTLTSQPLEYDRFLMFLAVLILTTIVADGYGIFLGTFLNQINGTFIGAITTCYMLVFCGFLIMFSHMSELMKAFSYLSTLRYGLEALVLAMYDNGRSNMVCPEEEMYCHYVKASTILKDLGMKPTNYLFNVVMLTLQFIGIKLVGFWSLKRKLKSG